MNRLGTPIDVRTRDVGLGLILTGARAGHIAGRLALAPAREIARIPVLGRPLRLALAGLASDGQALAGALLSAPELERAVDRVLASPLMDAVGRSLAQHRVVERVAEQVAATIDLDRLAGAVLEDPRTDRLVVRVLESRLLDDLTDRVLDSREMQRVIEHIASSPEVLAAVSSHTETLAEEMVSDVRRRTERVDDFAERTVRRWLRQPRAGTS